MRFSVISILILLIAACNSGTNSQQEKESIQLPEQIPEDVESISNMDSSFVNSFIGNLKGIEKHAVRNDFYMMTSLLANKGDTISSNRMVNILKKKDEYVLGYIIEELDGRSGYMRYRPQGAEVVYTTTYWNMEAGADLIALEAWSCGPVCESEIVFTKFVNGKYSRLNAQDVIPAIDSLPSRLLPGYQPDGDPVEFRYILPRKGKNMQFCLEDNCLELIWDEGVFRLSNK